MTLDELVFKQYGIKTITKTSGILLPFGSVKTIIAQPNPNRIALTIWNGSGKAVTIWNGYEFFTYKRLILTAYYGNISLRWNTDFSLITDIWSAYNDSVDTNYFVSVTEVLII